MIEARKCNCLNCECKNFAASATHYLCTSCGLNECKQESTRTVFFAVTMPFKDTMSQRHANSMLLDGLTEEEIRRDIKLQLRALELVTLTKLGLSHG